MLDISKAIKIQKRSYKNKKGHIGSVTTVYTFLCKQCNKNEIKSETKYLSKHSGKCRYCVHKGTPFLSTYKHLKDNVARTNLKRKKQKSFDLTFEEFKEFIAIKNCHYCHENILWVEHTGLGRHRYNLDRKDSNKGYIKDNLVVCCKRCNYMKGAEFSYEEFYEVVKLIDSMRDGSFIKKSNK